MNFHVSILENMALVPRSFRDDAKTDDDGDRRPIIVSMLLVVVAVRSNISSLSSVQRMSGIGSDDDDERGLKIYVCMLEMF